ncbi:MAG: tryptophan-rich sensory protein, partial [Nanoarchaeota archaeon]|nr:tryptophan-rich sensory protein [Nanoarchaeota archaeon]
MKKGANRINWKVLIVSFVIVYLVAFVGSLFTSPVTDSEWYDSIKPSITPPGWVFPIVWNVLFFLIGLSLYFSWINAKKLDVKKKLVIVFGI